MGNCLKTQLKEVVQNNELTHVGKFSYVIVNANNYVKVTAPKGYNIISNLPFDVVNSSGTALASSVTEYTVDDELFTPKFIKALSANQKLELDLYNFLLVEAYSPSYQLQAAKVNLKELQYAMVNSVIPSNYNSTIRLIGNIIGNLTANNASFWSKVVTFVVDGSEDDYMIDFTDLDSESLTELSTTYNKATCNIETLTTKNLTKLVINGCINMSGDLKTWAERMHLLGRTAGSCQVSYTNEHGVKAKVTWNGSDLYTLTGSYTPYIVFTQEGVSIQANAPA